MHIAWFVDVYEPDIADRPVECRGRSYIGTHLVCPSHCVQ